MESLVRMPDKRDPDWPKWVARATIAFTGVCGRGETDTEALGRLLDQVIQLTRHKAV